MSTAGLVARTRLGPLWPAVLTDWSVGSVLLALSSVGVGAVVVRRFPRHVVGWIFVAEGVLTGLVFVTRQITAVGLLSAPPSGMTIWGAWVFAWAVALNTILLALLVLLFPHGTPPTPKWRPGAVGDRACWGCRHRRDDDLAVPE